MYKLGWLPDGGNEEQYFYCNVWARQNSSGVDRLAIAPRSGYVKLLQNLASCLDEPYVLLYVLVVQRSQHSPGRYQSEYSFDRSQLLSFLSQYSDFLEHDARHSLWIRSASGNGLLVYDRHNIVYAYGPLETLIETISDHALSEVAELNMPTFKHSHHYHSEFDGDESRILTEEKWIHSLLRPGDENPC